MRFSHQLILFIIFIIFYSCKFNQNDSDVNLRKISIQLDSIFKEDQKFRSEIVMLQEENADSVKLKSLWKKQLEFDSINLVKVEKIIKELGRYPGKSLVGSSASKATFFVLQHAPKHIQGKYLNMIIEAGQQNELDKGLAAMYHDRYLMYRGKPQIYGTQISSYNQRNPETGIIESHKCVWPIADTTIIDSLRLWNGLIPLKDYLNSFGINELSFCD